MTLDYCDYCLRKGRKKNLARVTFDDHNICHYCPRCLKEVKENVKDIPWIREKGYTIEYPYK